jgi:hypothetical protein
MKEVVEEVIDLDRIFELSPWSKTLTYRGA